jgi:hypothetical protein
LFAIVQSFLLSPGSVAGIMMCGVRQRRGSATHNVRAVQALRRLADRCFKFRKA